MICELKSGVRVCSHNDGRNPGLVHLRYGSLGERSLKRKRNHLSDFSTRVVSPRRHWAISDWIQNAPFGDDEFD